MTSTNASPSAFGWDFQVNAAIVLMLDHIKEAKCIRVEGSVEDVEITLQDSSKIYGQAKSYSKLGDDPNAIAKLTKALTTLDNAAAKGDGSMFLFMTNSPNPFLDESSRSYFYGLSRYSLAELPQSAYDKVRDIISKNGFKNLETDQLEIYFIPFNGLNLRTRYKAIRERINGFLEDTVNDVPLITNRLMEIWQSDFFHNASMPDAKITITKEQFIWPLIVLVIESIAAVDYMKEFNDDEIEELKTKYNLIINKEISDYELITRVISDFYLSKKDRKSFVNEDWSDYLDIVDGISADLDTKEALVKVILFRILMQKQRINAIKKGVGL